MRWDGGDWCTFVLLYVPGYRYRYNFAICTHVRTYLCCYVNIYTPIGLKVDWWISSASVIIDAFHWWMKWMCIRYYVTYIPGTYQVRKRSRTYVNLKTEERMTSDESEPSKWSKFRNDESAGVLCRNILETYHTYVLYIQYSMYRYWKNVRVSGAFRFSCCTYKYVRTKILLRTITSTYVLVSTTYLWHIVVVVSP